MSLFKSSSLFTLGTLISRLSGLLRESIIAGVFGAGITLDAFLLANRIPNLLRELLAEGALGSSFTKVFTGLWEKSKDRALKLLAEALILSSLTGLVITILGIFFAPQFVQFFTLAAFYDPTKAKFIASSIGLTRVLFPFIAIMSVNAIISGALHHRGRFLLSAISPLALNLGYIGGALFLSQILDSMEWIAQYIAPQAITGLALGVLLGGLLQMLMQAFGIWRNYLSPGFKKGYFKGRLSLSSDIKKVLILMGPMVLASSSGQLNIFINTNFATSLESGTVSWLNLSFRILQFPIGLFAVAISTVLLPTLTRALQRNSGKFNQETTTKLCQAAEGVFWLMCFSFSYIAVNSRSIVGLLYQHGKFGDRAALETANLLYLYSFSLVGYGFIKVFSAIYYAIGPHELCYEDQPGTGCGQFYPKFFLGKLL